MSQSEMIVIARHEFHAGHGSPFEFDAIHAGGQLSGILLQVTAYTDSDHAMIDDMRAQADEDGEVEVNDPFAAREYMATLKLKMSSSSSDRLGETFEFEIKEADVPPSFPAIEIEGQKFAVRANTEQLIDDAIGIYALLQLTEEEFWQLRRLMGSGSVNIRRIGIDKDNLQVRFGGANYWSTHDDGPGQYYKHVVRFFPADDVPSKEIGLASSVEVRSIARVLTSLAARHEALVQALVDNGQIDEKVAASLRSDDIEALVNEDQKRRMVAPFSQVDDAEDHLD